MSERSTIPQPWECPLEEVVRLRCKRWRLFDYCSKLSVKASTATAPGLGLNDTYWGNWLFSRDAKRSILVNCDSALFREGLSSIHSVLLLVRLDSRSALILWTPGMWAALSHMLRSMHHSQISFPTRLQGSEWLVTIWFRIAIAVVLSVRIRRWVL